MKREETIYICERCGEDIRIPAKKLGPVHLSAKLPKEWKSIYSPENASVTVCHSCLADAKKHWLNFMQDEPTSKKNSVEK